MTTLAATSLAAGSPTYAIFGAAELFWCAECEGDEIFDRPDGLDSAEAFCVSCGTAIFLWVGMSDLTWAMSQPVASNTTPMSAVATPAA